MKGNLAIRKSKFADCVSQAQKRAYQVYDENSADEEGRKQLAAKLDEKEEGAKRRRIECIKANGLTIDVTCDKDLEDMDLDTSKVVIHADSCNETVTLSLPQHLVTLEVQASSLAQCGSVQWTGLSQLRSITIGSNCFSSSEPVSPSKSFSLSSCPSLQKLVIGDGSFVPFEVFSLSDLKELKEISLGDNAFCGIKSVTIESGLWIG